MTKYTKSEVGYSYGKPHAHCGLCEHYRAGSCEIVQGDIRPDYWCEKFKKGLRQTIEAAVSRASHYS